MPRPSYTREQAIAAFWSKVEVRGPEECWNWKAGRLPQGYGKVKWERRDTRAHRLAFFLSNGYLEQGKDVCHTCDNPPCCNPLHLFLGTARENVEDSIRKDRQTKGEKVGISILTAEKVRELRKDRASGISLQKLADKYGISRAAAWQVVSRKTWKHVIDGD